MNILWIFFIIPTFTLTQTEIMNYIEHLMNASSSYQSLTDGSEMYNHVKGMIDMGDCAINIMGDLKNFAPLLTYHSRLDWLVPNTEGIIELRKGDFIDMYCTYSFAEPFINYTALTAYKIWILWLMETCIASNNFVVWNGLNMRPNVLADLVMVVRIYCE